MGRKTKAMLECEIVRLKARIAELEFANYLREGGWFAMGCNGWAYGWPRLSPVAIFERVDVILSDGSELYGRTAVDLDWDTKGGTDEIMYYRFNAVGRDLKRMAESQQPGWTQPNQEGGSEGVLQMKVLESRNKREGAYWGRLYAPREMQR